MAGEHYFEFIEEAFVKPIRSVLIVDDDYPTFDEILSNRVLSNKTREVIPKKSWYTDPAHIQSVIGKFRARDQPLLVDIHDGETVKFGDEVKVAAHLHQSDLLVLDYELDKAKPNDGERAIEILRSLMSNDHFNLVVIHTREDLDPVFEAVLLGLLKPSSIALSPEDSQKAGTLIEKGEDDSEGFSDRLLKSAANQQYLHSRLNSSTYLRTMAQGQQPYSAFKAHCDEAGWTREVPGLVLRYALAQMERELLPKMNVESTADLKWSPGSIKWIKSDAAFVAFSNKHDADDLLDELRKALYAWKPKPSRLFLAKLRAEMDEYGVMAQSQALHNNSALAHWYRRLLRADGSQRRWHIAESVSRHSDQLMAAILPRVEDFATRLVEAEATSGDVEKVCEDHFKVNLSEGAALLQAEREHNAYACSKKPEGWHLTTGHVFLKGEEYWLCLSPACDMVPSQLSAARIATLGDRLPFIAVKLQPVPDGNKPDDIQSNRYVFLQFDGCVKGFCFNNRSGVSSAPDWHTLYAEKCGEFAKGTFNFTLLRTEDCEKELISKRYDATVVSQLRYEYALNLMQRLGVSLTRVGLDFVG